MHKKLKDILKFAIFLGLGVFLIWWFLFQKLTAEQRSEVWQSFIQADYLIVGVALLIGISSFVLRAVRWKMLLEPMGYKISNANIMMAVMTGYFSNLAFPRLGEFVRCGMLDRYEKVPFTKSIGTVITERVIDVVVFAFIAILTLITGFGVLKDYLYERFFSQFEGQFGASFWIKVAIIVLVVVALFALFWFVFRKKIAHTKIYQKIKAWLLEMWEGLISMRNLRRPGLFIFYTFLLWFAYFLMAYLIFFAVPETSHLGPSAGLACLFVGTIGIVVTPGGIGIYPMLIAEVLKIYGVAITTGTAMGWLIWSSQNVIIVLGGLLSFILLPILNKKKKTAE